ncbi:MAG TPA: patatin-like phospholipase family protein [Geobacteraceae bacterium]
MKAYAADKSLKGLVLIFMLFVTTPAFAAQPDTPEVYAHVEDTEGYTPFAFAISGGISLGSYEAGINWAFLKYLKVLREDALREHVLPPKLMAVTGASAGGINALMTGINWCVDNTKITGTEFSDSIDRNLFKDIWLDVGFNSLLPDNGNRCKDGKPCNKDGKPYRDDDGLLTRNAFNRVLNKLRRMMDSDIFVNGCNVPVGLMVTRTKPLIVSVSELEVKNERFIIPLLLSVDEKGKIQFKSNVLNSDVAGLGNTIYLAGSGERDKEGLPVIEKESVIDAVLASSAFPVAFGRKQLNYCINDVSTNHSASSLQKDPLCPHDYHYDSADFIDGGLFDNIPLGAAKSLGEPHEFDFRSRNAWVKAGRRFNYLYIDPDNRRENMATIEEKPASAPVEPDMQAEKKTYGLRSQLGFLSGAITTGRNYELYKTLISGDWTRQATQFAARKALPAIDSEIRNKGGTIAGHNEKPPASLCSELYAKIKRDKSADLDTGELLLARGCLRLEAQTLENEYALFPYAEANRRAGMPSLSNERVAELRRTLIAHMYLLAHKTDPRLDLSVQQLYQDKLGDRRIMLSDRVFPITGEYMAAFGAFIDVSFREFDYYAGTYDAVNNIARYTCEAQLLTGDKGSKNECEANTAKRVYEQLGIGADDSARTVFASIAKKEHPGERWKWADSSTMSREVNNLVAVGESLDDAENHPGKNGESEFSRFIRKLASSGYDRSQASPELANILRNYQKDEINWYYPLTSRASERLVALEKTESESKGGGTTVKALVKIGALGVNTYIHDEKRLTLSPSSAPNDKWQNFLPYEAFFDIKNGGLALSWEPRLHLGNDLFLSFKATPIGYNKFGNDWIWFSQGDLYAMYNEQNNMYSVGAGPTINSTWDTWPGHKRVNYGAAIFGGLFNKLRLTLGLRSFERGGFGGDNMYIQLGITDIPGIGYWLFK